jgi:hypothetical protein
MTVGLSIASHSGCRRPASARWPRPQNGPASARCSSPEATVPVGDDWGYERTIAELGP